MNLLQTERISWTSSLQSTSFNINSLKLALVKTDPFLTRNCKNDSLHCFVRTVLRINYPVQTPGTEGSSRHDAWGILCDNMYPRSPSSQTLIFCLKLCGLMIVSHRGIISPLRALKEKEWTAQNQSLYFTPVKNLNLLVCVVKHTGHGQATVPLVYPQGTALAWP